MSKVNFSRRCFLIGGLSALFAARTSATSEEVLPATTFAHSVGVNTHLSSAAYVHRFELVASLLGASGIRYLRDELRPANNLRSWQELHRRYGIRSHLLVSPATNTIPEMLRYISALGVEKISAIEGQNEGDSPWFMAQKAAQGNWSAAVISYQEEVYQALRSRYSVAALPIVSPTVLDWKPADAALLSDAASFCDIVAIHSYVQHGQMPETDDSYAAVSWYLQNMRDGFKPGAPVMATETGYNTMGGRKAVSEVAAAIYIPRLLLNNFAMGI